MDVQREEGRKSLAALLASTASTVNQCSILRIIFSVNFFFVKLLSPPVEPHMSVQQVSSGGYPWPESLLHNQVPQNVYLKIPGLAHAKGREIRSHPIRGNNVFPTSS